MTNVLFDALFRPHEGSKRTFLSHANRGISFEDYLAISACYAHFFTELGVRKGDRVALQVAKSPEALAIYAACVRTGAVLLPLNTAYTPSEVAYFVADAEPALIIADPASKAKLTEVAGAARLLTLGPGRTGSLPEMAATHVPNHVPVACASDDLAAILYTSGTTGRSKGAMLSHENLLSNARTLTALWQFTEADVLLHALPIFHTHGLFVAVNTCLLAGSQMAFLPKFDLAEVLSTLPHATAMMGVPTFYTRLLGAPEFDRKAAAHMRLFVSGSAPLLAETHSAFEDRTGHRILERYGMTETNMITSNPYDGERKAGTVGRPLPSVEVKVTDPATGNELPDGDIGIVEVSGPNVFQGYWRMPEKTAGEFRADGYFITGDLGRFDAEGYLSIVGRQKDLIISGGYNVYPREIELLIDDLPGVLESAVIGLPDADFGEAVLAVVVPLPGVEIDVTRMKAKLAGQLARFKQPKEVVLLPELPRNTMGKVQKAALRDTYRDHFRT